MHQARSAPLRTTPGILGYLSELLFLVISQNYFVFVVAAVRASSYVPGTALLFVVTEIKVHLSNRFDHSLDLGIFRPQAVQQSLVGESDVCQC